MPEWKRKVGETKWTPKGSWYQWWRENRFPWQRTQTTPSFLQSLPDIRGRGLFNIAQPTELTRQIQSMPATQWQASRKQQAQATVSTKPDEETEEDKTLREMEKAGLAYQKAQTALLQAQWAREVNEQAWQAAQAQQMAEGLAWQKEQAALRAGTFTGGGVNIRAQQAQEFEDWRNRLAMQLTGPANEVARWFVQHKANPYRQNAGGVSGAAKQALREAEASGGTEAVKVAQERIAQEQYDIKEQEEEEERALTEYEMGPTAPQWMRQIGFLPEVGGTLPLAKGLGRVETPSGQQLTGLEPTQAQYLSGAIDWFGKGKSWQDILAQAEIMQPYTPRGAGTRRWTPARQV